MAGKKFHGSRAIITVIDPKTGKKVQILGFVATSRDSQGWRQNKAYHEVGKVQGGVGVATTSEVHDCNYGSDGRCKVCGFHRP